MFSGVVVAIVYILILLVAAASIKHWWWVTVMMIVIIIAMMVVTRSCSSCRYLWTKQRLRMHIVMLISHIRIGTINSRLTVICISISAQFIIYGVLRVFSFLVMSYLFTMTV